MSTDVEYPPEQTALSLVNGILVDLQHLVEQQMRLTRRELEQEIRQRSSAAVIFAFGVGVFFLDAIVSCLMLVHLMHWATSPNGFEQAWLPLWACHALVAVVLGVIGGILIGIGRAKFKSVNRSQTIAIEDLKESAQWTTTRN